MLPDFEFHWIGCFGKYRAIILLQSSIMRFVRLWETFG